MSSNASVIRFGCLGAARIAPYALIGPARDMPGVRVLAVAARDPKRAHAFAKRHDVPVVSPSYEALLANVNIDAIYNPLPNSHHAEWTIKALEAGKDVLCEKPFTANAQEARKVIAAAERTGRRVVEAFHWRFHPLAARMVELCRSGRYGAIERVETSLCIPCPPGDIRFRLDLAGGAMMDTGTYAAHMLRQLAGEEPEVVSAKPTWLRAGVDRAMEAEVRFPSGASGRLRCSLASFRLLSVYARVRFERGELYAFNPILPQVLHRLVHGPRGGKKTHETFGSRGTYSYQLEAFRDHIASGAPLPTDSHDAIANMELIDAVYRAAGDSPREGTL